jgi:hypothetical protein
MAGYLSSSDILALTGALQMQFDTFSAHRSIEVTKQPRQQWLEEATTLIHYPQTPESGHSYLALSHSFPCVLAFKDGGGRFANELHIPGGPGTINVRVEQHAYDYIKSGENAFFKIGDVTYERIVKEKVVNYLGLQQYILTLQGS